MNGHRDRDLLALHILIGERLAGQQACTIIDFILEEVSPRRGHRLGTNGKLVGAAQLDIVIAGIIDGDDHIVGAGVGDPDIVVQVCSNKPAGTLGDLIDYGIFLAVVDNAVLDVIPGLIGQSEGIQRQLGDFQLGCRAALVAAVLDVTIFGCGGLFGLVDERGALLASVSRLDGSSLGIRVLKVDKEMEFLLAGSCVVHNALGGRSRPLLRVIIDLTAGRQHSRAVGIAGQHGDIGGLNGAHVDIGVEQPVLDLDYIIAILDSGGKGI